MAKSWDEHRKEIEIYDDLKSRNVRAPHSLEGRFISERVECSNCRFCLERGSRSVLSWRIRFLLCRKQRRHLAEQNKPVCSRGKYWKWITPFTGKPGEDDYRLHCAKLSLKNLEQPKEDRGEPRKVTPPASGVSKLPSESLFKS